MRRRYGSVKVLDDRHGDTYPDMRGVDLACDEVSCCAAPGTVAPVRLLPAATPTSPSGAAIASS